MEDKVVYMDVKIYLSVCLIVHAKLDGVNDFEFLKKPVVIVKITTVMSESQ